MWKSKLPEGRRKQTKLLFLLAFGSSSTRPSHRSSFPLAFFSSILPFFLFSFFPPVHLSFCQASIRNLFRLFIHQSILPSPSSLYIYIYICIHVHTFIICVHVYTHIPFFLLFHFVYSVFPFCIYIYVCVCVYMFVYVHI
jgi:hypothetical protein